MMNTSVTSKSGEISATKSGYLYKQSDHLKSWRKRFLEANTSFLKISKDEKGKDQKFVDTRDYGIRYNGKHKDRYILSMQILKGRSSKYKKFVFGSEDELTVKDWYEFFTAKRTDLNSSIDNATKGSFIDSEDEKVEASPKNSNISSPELPSPTIETFSVPNGIDREVKKESPVIKPREIVKEKEENFLVGDFKLPDDSPNWIDDIFYSHIKGNNIWDKEAIAKLDVEDTCMSEKWNIIQNSEKIKILQNLNDSNQFRCLFKFNQTTPEQILKVLLDVKQRGKWDNSFEKAEILTYVPSSQQYLIHQVNRPFGMLYFPREFIFARYTFKSKLCYFMIDKSAENYDAIPKSYKCPRGFIKYSIIQLVQIKNEVYLNLLLSTTNGGITTSSQDAQITLFALNNYNEIPKVFYDYPADYKTELLSMPDISSEKVKKIDIMDSRSKQLTIEIENEMTKKEEQKEDIRSQASEDRNGDDDSDGDEFGKQEVPSIDLVEYETSKPLDGKEFWLKRYEKVTAEKHTVECVDKHLKLRPLTKEEMEDKHQVVNGNYIGPMWKRDPENGLELLDKELLDAQRKVLGHFLKSMGKNLFEGKSIMSISMPIAIFSDDSMLQRATSGYGYIPYFLPKAAELNDSLEAFKLILSFYFTNGHLAIRQEKPFNPILGETYQGYIGNIPVFLEQISHHPPISAIYIKEKGFMMHGTYNIDANLGLNSATGNQKGKICCIVDKPNIEVYAYFPSACISGTITGKRIFNWSKRLKVFDVKHNYYADIQFNPDEKGMITSMFSKKVIEADRARGAIYQVTPEFIDELRQKDGYKAKFDEKKHAIKEIAAIDGLWTSHLDIGGKRYWNIEENRPFKLHDLPNKALPSDASYREDLIYRKLGDLKNGQIQKDRLENIQRADRKLRGKHGKK